MDLHSQALAEVFAYLIPEMILGAAACALFLGGTFRIDRRLWSGVALGGLALATMATWWGPTPSSSLVSLFAVPVRFDALVTFTRHIAFLGAMAFVFFSTSEVPERQTADHHACLLLIAAGVSLTAAANDLVALFLALELISIPTYVLLYLPRHDDPAQEAALKYFLLSVFSSALLLFGFSYLYGLTGTTNLSAILDTLNRTPARELPTVAQIALIMIVAGLGFRITAAPFHFYAPDVYQGTAAIGAALLAFVPKVAGFVALIRVLGFVLPDQIPARAGLLGMGLSDQAPILFWFLAAFTMTLGNILALLQDNLKRLLAYSSIAHAGYMLVALAAAPYLRSESEGSAGVEALLFYLVAYGAMTVGAFAVIAFLHKPRRPVETVDDLAGLSRSHPGVALVMALFLFSLIGIPLTAGFLGKFLVIFSALALSGEPAHLYRILAVIAMLNAAIGAWYYLRLVAVMYLRNPLRPVEARLGPAGLATLGICVALTLGLSIGPGANWLMEKTRQAAGARTTGQVVQR